MCCELRFIEVPFSSCIHLWCMIAEYAKWIRLGKKKVFITSGYIKLIFQGWSHPVFTAAGVQVSRNKTTIFRILFKKCVVESEWFDSSVARELIIKTSFLVYLATPRKGVFRWSDKSLQLSSSTNSMIFQSGGRSLRRSLFISCFYVCIFVLNQNDNIKFFSQSHVLRFLFIWKINTFSCHWADSRR